MKRNFIYYLLPSASQGLISFVVTIPLTTYYLNPADFGVASILGVVTALISPLASTGVTWVMGAEFYKSSEEDRYRLVFNILLLDFVMTLFWVIVLALSASWYLPLFIKEYRPEHLELLGLGLAGTLIGCLWPTISYTLILLKRAKAHAVLEIIRIIAASATTCVALMVFKLRTSVLFLPPIAAGAVGLIGGLWCIRREILPGLSRRWLKEIFQTGMPTIPVNVFEIIANTSDRIFIQMWSSLSHLGLYAHSNSYRQLFTLGTKAFSRTYVPDILETLSKGRDISPVVAVLHLWYGLVGVGGVFVTLFAGEIVDLLTHGKFMPAAPLVPLWFLLLPIYTYGTPYIQYLFLQKQIRFLSVSSIAVSAVFIGIGALTIYLYSYVGACVTAIAGCYVIQARGRLRAVKLGCPVIAEKAFYGLVAYLLCLYSAVQWLNPGLPAKVACMIIFSIPLLVKSGIVAAVSQSITARFSVK